LLSEQRGVAVVANEARLRADGSGIAAEHRTVARVMAILEFVLASDSEGVRLLDLAVAVDAPKSSVHGLAKGLVATGYLREERGRYFLGPAISSLIAVGPTSLPDVYHHALEQLTARWNETTTLATLVGNSLVYVHAVESKEFIRAAPNLNVRMSLWPRSSAKCFLAFMDPRRLEDYLRKNHPEPADAEMVRKELETIRETRVGVNHVGAGGAHIGIASPVLNGDSQVMVAIAMAGPRSRMEERLEDMIQSLRETTEMLSHGGATL
jgi:DNA-binding IclR family transcriptional regulator